MFGIMELVLTMQLNLVDLAGSERLKKTMDDADDLVKIDATTKKESMYINQSLTYLEQVRGERSESRSKPRSGEGKQTSVACVAS